MLASFIFIYGAVHVRLTGGDVLVVGELGLGKFGFTVVAGNIPAGGVDGLLGINEAGNCVAG